VEMVQGNEGAAVQVQDDGRRSYKYSQTADWLRIPVYETTWSKCHIARCLVLHGSGS
jgi:hypothetical protein